MEPDKGKREGVRMYIGGNEEARGRDKGSVNSHVVCLTKARTRVLSDSAISVPQ